MVTVVVVVVATVVVVYLSQNSTVSKICTDIFLSLSLKVFKVFILYKNTCDCLN